jgi:hypothetical protein
LDENYPTISLALSPARVQPSLDHSSSFFSTLQQLIMLAKDLKNFLADSPPATVRLEIKKHFEALSDKQKRYAHYISKYESYLSLLL